MSSQPNLFPTDRAVDPLRNRCQFILRVRLDLPPHEAADIVGRMNAEELSGVQFADKCSDLQIGNFLLKELIKDVVCRDG